MALRPLESIGDYRVTRSLGLTRFGASFEVTSRKDGTLWHLTLLPEAWRGDPAVQARLQADAGALASLGEHPGVLAPMAIVVEDGLIALVTQRVEAEDLEAALDRRSAPWPWDDVWRLLEPVIAAVSFAHARGVCHRALAPAAILLNSDGGVRVRDFGVTAALEAGEVSRVEARIGGAPFTAPEQLAGQSGGTEADVWAIGALACRMLAPAAEAQDATHALDDASRVLMGKVEMPDDDMVPRRVWLAIEAALAVDPTERPRDAEALARLLAGEAGAHVDASEREDGDTEARLARVGASASPSLRSRSGLSSGLRLVVVVASFAFAIYALYYLIWHAFQFRPWPAGGPSTPELVRIEPGRFRMGSPEDEPDRRPGESLREVTLMRPFWMTTTEITRRQWNELLQKRWIPSLTEDCPATDVTWEQAVRFANALSEDEGLVPCYGPEGFRGLECPGYRLPTEAEWEYAARAGTASVRYGELDRIAWHRHNTEETLQEVAQKEPNAWGLYDMLGNAAEWTHDWHASVPEGPIDPAGPETGDERVVRGCGVNCSGIGIRAAARTSFEPDEERGWLGFRLVRSIP